MPRAGFVGDEPGSALIGVRLVGDIMNLCFLVETNPRTPSVSGLRSNGSSARRPWHLS